MKKILPILMSMMLVVSLAPMAHAQSSFKDVSTSHTFYEDIQFLTSLEIISGFEDGTFRPGQEVTRAQAAIMIGRTLGFSGEPKATVFPDVSKSSVASGYIQAAVNEEIIQGFPDGTFRPNEPVTRGQLAIFISRAFLLTESAKVSFSDVSTKSTAYPYIGHIYYAGITKGYPDGTYRPNQAVKRGEFAAYISRTINFIIADFLEEDFDFDEYLDENFSEEYFSDEDFNFEDYFDEEFDLGELIQ